MANITWRDIANAAIDLKAEDFLRGGATVIAILASGAITVGTLIWSLSGKATEFTSQQAELAKQVADLKTSVDHQVTGSQQVRDRIVWIEARCCENARPATRNTFGYTPTTNVNVRTNTAGTP